MHKCTFSAFVPKHLHRTTPQKCWKHTNFIRTNQTGTRLSSTSTIHHSETRAPQAELSATRHEALTLQHKVENILEPVFKVGERPSELPRTAQITEFWRDVLSDTFENLSTAAERPARIVVFGVDEWSGARDLVTALLEEPLSSDQTQQDILRNRWQNVDPLSKLTISTTHDEESSSIHLSSSYMRQFSTPIEIIELCSSTPLSTSPNSLLPGCLFKADVPIIVFNPLTTHPSSLKHFKFPSHAIFVASGNPHLNNTPLQQATQKQLVSQSPLKLGTPDDLGLLFVDSSRALSAIQTFRSDPTSPLAIQQYLNNFTGSGISRVTQAIRNVVDAGANTSSPIAFLRNRTALIQLHEVMGALLSNVQDVQRSLDDIRVAVSCLTRKMEEAKIRAPGEILGCIPETGQGKRSEERDVVGESLRLASKEMKVVLETLSWWKAIWHIDEISGIVGAAVDRVWCKDLKKQLILQTGRLLSLQAEFTKSAMTLVNHQTLALTPPSSPTKTPPNQLPLFTAHILKNTLSQLSSSPSYTLTPSSLTTPITRRKSQILAFPTSRLHAKAQHLVLQMSAGVTVGSGLTWAGWMGHLTQSVGESGTGVWNAVGMGMDPATGMALGLLIGAYSIRRVVGKWEKEKTRWWADWERIGQGVERDLKAAIDDTMREKVVVVADTACQGLNELCDKHQEEVDKTKDDVLNLQSDLRNITSRAQV